MTPKTTPTQTPITPQHIGVPTCLQPQMLPPHQPRPSPGRRRNPRDFPTDGTASSAAYTVSPLTTPAPKILPLLTLRPTLQPNFLLNLRPNPQPTLLHTLRPNPLPTLQPSLQRLEPTLHSQAHPLPAGPRQGIRRPAHSHLPPLPPHHHGQTSEDCNSLNTKGSPLATLSRPPASPPSYVPTRPQTPSCTCDGSHPNPGSSPSALSQISHPQAAQTQATTPSQRCGKAMPSGLKLFALTLQGPLEQVAEMGLARPVVFADDTFLQGAQAPTTRAFHVLTALAAPLGLRAQPVKCAVHSEDTAAAASVAAALGMHQMAFSPRAPQSVPQPSKRPAQLHALTKPAPS
jgi:hypothetical protein